MIINNDLTCPKCGAYWNTNGYCSNGHVRGSRGLKHILSDTEIEEVISPLSKRQKKKYRRILKQKKKEDLIEALLKPELYEAW